MIKKYNLFKFLFLFSVILLAMGNGLSAQNECNGTLVSLQYVPGAFPEEVSWQVISPDGTVILVGNGYSGSFTFCAETDGCYSVAMYDSWGDGWNGGVLYVYTNFLNGSSAFTLNGGYTGYGAFGINTSDCEGIANSGCTDPSANNYDPTATWDDGSCEYSGCTDPNAINYSYYATTDDGSCEYCNGEGSVAATLYVCAFGNGGEINLVIVDDEGNEVASVSGLNDYGIAYYTICLEPNTCYTAQMSNSAGNAGWYGGYFWVTNGNGTQLINSYLPGDAVYSEVDFSIDGTCGPVAGCMDPNADNYNPEAQMSDGSCTYSGCTDPNALNYDWQATTDDGSCEYCNGEGSVIATLYVCAFGNGGEIYLEIVDDNGNVVTTVSGLNDYGIAYYSICLAPGTCYTANMSNSAGNTGWYGGYFWVNNNNGTQLITGALYEGETSSSIEFSVDGTCGPVWGCTDPAALNYDPNATANNGTCIYPYYGCTDPSALNYNPYANADDGSCTYPEDCLQNAVLLVLSPGGWPEEISYDVYDENGNWVANGVYGYNGFACVGDGCYTVYMYDSFGDGWNGAFLNVYVNGVATASLTLDYGANGVANFGVNTSGCTPDVAGCTDPYALNYNYFANVDDGSCIYAEDCENNLVQINLNTSIWGSEISWSILGNGVVVASGGGYDSWSSYNDFICLEDGCYTLVMEDSWGDGWNGAYLYIWGNNVFGYVTLENGSYGTYTFGVNSDCGISGCTDPAASNYNPDATIDDGSCEYNDNDGFNGDGFQGLELDLELYPNPTNGGMVLDVNHLNALDGIEIDVLGITGQVVKRVQIQNDQPYRKFSFDVSELSGGYYVLKLENGDRVITAAFVKE